METVASKAVLPLVRILEKRGVVIRYYLQQAGINFERLRDPKGQIEWDRVVDLLERVQDEIPEERIWRSLAHEFSRESSYRWAHVLLRPVLGIEALYRIVTRWMGPIQFPFIERSLKVRGKGWLEIELKIPEHLPVSPTFFWISGGTLESLPVLLGAGYAKVDITLDGHRALYSIRFNDENWLLLLWRRVTTFVVSRKRFLQVMDEQVSTFDEIGHLRASLLHQQVDLACVQRLARLRYVMIGNSDVCHLATRFVATVRAEIPELSMVKIAGKMPGVEELIDSERVLERSAPDRILSYVTGNDDHLELHLWGDPVSREALSLLNEVLPDLAAAFRALATR